jgi:hypothetical protein
VSAFLAEALPERLHPAAALISQLNRRAAEQSAGRPAVRQGLVSREAAADYLRPWELPARWSRTEERRSEVRDAASAYWEPTPNWLVPVSADAVAVRRVAGTPLPEKFPAKAGADRKESDLAGESAAQDGPESECREAQPAVR